MDTFVFNTKYVKCPIAMLSFGKYADGSTAVLVQDSITGEQLSKATISLIAYGELPAEGNIFVKDYGENEGVVEALHEADIIGQPLRWLDAGYATNGVAECELLVEAK